MALPSVEEGGGRRAALTVVVLPGLGLKWQRDQLCVESQPFFVLPAKELEARAVDPKQACKLTHSYLVTSGRVQQTGVILVGFSKPPAQLDMKKKDWRTLHSSQKNLLSTCCLRETKLLLLTIYTNKTQ